MTQKYPMLKEMSVVELAQLLQESKKYNDNEFRDAILLEFKERSKDENIS